MILEGLTGLRSAPDAARALGITVARYYTVEAQAIAGLITACEPAAPGPAPGAATEREVARLRQEHHRRQEQGNSLGCERSCAPPSAAWGWQLCGARSGAIRLRVPRDRGSGGVPACPVVRSADRGATADGSAGRVRSRPQRRQREPARYRQRQRHPVHRRVDRGGG